MNRHDPLNRPAPLRLRMMHAYAASWNANPGHIARGSDGITWRDARGHGVATVKGNGYATRSNCWAHDCIHMENGALDHLRQHGRQGESWYCDEGQSATVTGHVSLLTHGRYIAWVSWSDVDGITALASPFEDEREALRAADSLAERIAEDEREHSSRWNMASREDEKREDARGDLKQCAHAARDIIRVWREQKSVGPLSAGVCRILRADLADMRAGMRKAIVKIENARERIAQLDMEGEF